MDAHRRKVLAEDGLSELVGYLRAQNRFVETIPLLEPLVQRRPDNLQYRVWLMNAYFKTNHPELLTALLNETHGYFHRDDRWNENAMAMLGRSCLENAIYRKAADYLAEAIAHRQQTASRRGMGDSVLSGYYGDQARAFAGLKKTPEAVDAAAAAVVAWGPDINNRRNALEALHAVLWSAPDLEGYVARLDKQAADSGEENPILRKAIGQVYRDRGRWGKAIAQLQIAAEVQPNDAETYQGCWHVMIGRTTGKGRSKRSLPGGSSHPATSSSMRTSASGWSRSDRPASRSGHILLSSRPCQWEAESHGLLADVFQRQDRWENAVEQWRQVAAGSAPWNRPGW